MLTRVIARSAGFHGLRITRDDELDAALALCGAIDLPIGPRYCFQTTYLNDRFTEYSTLGIDQRLIWVIREPYSVVRSMVYNWRRFALNELFDQCGKSAMKGARVSTGGWSFLLGAVEKACWAYVGKSSQLFELVKVLPMERLLVVDYDELTASPGTVLPHVFAFARETYRSDYGNPVRADRRPFSGRLRSGAVKMVEEIAMETYQRCLKLCDDRRSV